MPSEIQRGELVDRLRRFAGTTGRMPLQLDETVVPVLNVGDLFQPPYRLAVRGFTGQDERPAAVGFPSQIACTLPAVPSGSIVRGAALIREIWIDNQNASAAIFTLRIAYNLAAAFPLIINTLDLDRYLDQNGSIQRLPPQIRASNSVAAVGANIILFTLAASERFRLTLPTPIVMGPGTEVLIGSPNNAVNRTAFFGEWHPDAILFP
jgi:hypothetical protein